MARGGINKALVKQARDALLAKGQNPSIDSIRVQLGNTGSKTTIHRYLRELEEEEGTRLDDETLLSNTLKDMVVRLAARLREEAGAIVEQATEQHHAEKQQWTARNDTAQQELTAANERIEELKTLLANAQQLHADASENAHAMSIKTQRLEQQVEDIIEQLKGKDVHIQSLEDKHQHAREALEHYRQSVKEQREQDLRRHEQQIQQLQAEQRQLNQTLSIKQTDITQLNKDNARLVAEVGEAQKQLSASESKLQAQERQLRAAEEKIVSLTAHFSDQQVSVDKQAEALSALKAELTDAEEVKHCLDIELAKLRAELEVKNLVIAKLGIDE